MTDKEFNILDELYFISSFSDLLEKIDLDETTLKTEIWNMISKEWIRCIENEEEVEITLDSYDSNFKNYLYIATKKGLFAHNSTL